MLASLVARALHQRYRRVEALTLPQHVGALARMPDIDEVLADEEQEEERLAEMLHHRHYDAAVVTWATARTARVPQLAAIPVRVGQARRLYSWRFTKRVIVRSENGDVTSHWSQILLDYARALGCDTSDTLPSFRPTEGDELEAQAVLTGTGQHDDRFAIVHATNAIAPQRGIWPTQGWIELVRVLQTRLELNVLLTGSNADAAIVSRIAGETGAFNVAGRTSIGGLAALARRARVFVGITTGAMHVSAAVGAPTVGIFPFQSDTPERWAPLGPRTAVVRATYPCRAGERKETCPDYACIAHLDVPRILAAAQALLTVKPSFSPSH